MTSLPRLSLTILLLLAPAAAQRPPLIDRELFFGDPEISGVQISPDGKYIAFLKPLNKTRNIWVKPTDAPFDSAKPITNDTKRPIPGYLWSRDGKFVLYVQDKLGDENYSVYAVNPGEAPAAGVEVPAARNLTDVKGVRTMLYEVPRSEPDIVYVGLNDRDKSWHDLYKIRISTGERTLLRQNADRITGWIFDRKDQLRLATRSAGMPWRPRKSTNSCLRTVFTWHGSIASAVTSWGTFASTALSPITSPGPAIFRIIVLPSLDVEEILTWP